MANDKYTYETELKPDHGSSGRFRDNLCEILLNDIQNSVKVFKPSKSLSSLQQMKADPNRPVAEIDVVVSGGGLKGYFMTGCSHILKHELRKQNIRIARIAGSSAGAWVGMFMLADLGTNNWLETYYRSRGKPGMTMHEAYEEMWPWLSSCLPENTWEICRGRLFISVTEVTVWGFKNHMISDFTSNMDLFECLLASSTVPYISLPNAMRKYRDMWVVDGGVTNNTPVFPDNVRRQLVFRLSDVAYPVKLLINPQDTCIEALVVRGAILMSRFLQGEPSDSFAWLGKDEAVTSDPITLSDLTDGGIVTLYLPVAIGAVGMLTFGVYAISKLWALRHLMSREAAGHAVNNTQFLQRALAMLPGNQLKELWSSTMKSWRRN